MTICILFVVWISYGHLEWINACLLIHSYNTWILYIIQHRLSWLKTMQWKSLWDCFQDEGKMLDIHLPLQSPPRYNWCIGWLSTSLSKGPDYSLKREELCLILFIQTHIITETKKHLQFCVCRIKDRLSLNF